MIIIQPQNSIAARAGVTGLTQHKGALGSNPRSGVYFLPPAYLMHTVQLPVRIQNSDDFTFWSFFLLAFLDEYP